MYPQGKLPLVSSGTSIDPSSLASHPPKTEPVELVNEGEQRSRLLNVYTYTLEQLLQEQEQRDQQHEKKGAKEKDENCKKFSADDADDGGCGRRYFTRCIQKCNETLAPYKLLYVFIRGGPSSTYAGWIFERDSLSSSFFAIFALITVAHVMQGPTLSLTDTSTLQTLGPNRSHEYGWQVAFGKASFAIYIILITIIIDMASSTWSRCEIEIHVEDYRIAFVVFFGTTSCAIGLLFAYCINMKFDNPNESNVYNLKKIFCRINNAALLPIMCYLAANEGAISVFLPFHLTNLGSPSLLVKSARIVSGVSELFLAFHLGQLIQSRGHIVLLSCGAIGYLLCFLAYALITTPFGILPVQVIQGVSHALTWNVLVARLSGEVNPENLATLQGCLSGIYLCGLGLGSVVAGVGVSHVGAPITFFCFAFACLVVGILMGIGSMSSNERTTRTKTIRYNPLPESDESDTG